MSVSLSIGVPKGLYIKDPETTDLGKMIVSRSIPLMLELGFDKFTFKKLGAQIESPEASVYRYFSSKHQLLNYVTAWYWNWLTYILLDRTRPITNPKKRLKAALTVLVDAGKMDISMPHIDEALLHKVIVREGAKAENDDEGRGIMREVLVAGHEVFCEEFAKVNGTLTCE
jgi:AcrR family transcriptional regulator